MEPNPYPIAAVIVLLVLSWAVASLVAAWFIGGAIRLRDRRAARPHYRRATR